MYCCSDACHRLLPRFSVLPSLVPHAIVATPELAMRVPAPTITVTVLASTANVLPPHVIPTESATAVENKLKRELAHSEEEVYALRSYRDNKVRHPVYCHL